MGTATAPEVSVERADLLEHLSSARHFLTFTARNLTDEQAALTPTASALSIGGLIKHVSRTESGWARFAQGDPSGVTGPTEWTEDSQAARTAEFRMEPDETLTGLLADYAAVARRTDELIRTLPDLDRTYPLPPAPWFPADARRTVRQVFLHLAAEISQHAGHADIIRETIDGAKSMG